MIIDILTIFPDSFSYLQESIVKRAQQKGEVQINIYDLRKWTDDKRKTVDDKPFGGGAGMVLKVGPIYNALKDLGVYPERDDSEKIIITSAKGKKWGQGMAEGYSQQVSRLVIICGHYEGVDNRVVEHLVDAEISVGEFVLSGGELPAMIIVDSIIRLLPGVLGNSESLEEETSFVEGGVLKEYPHYTRPEHFSTEEGESWSVPGVLLSGDHSEIKKWQKRNRK